MKTYCCGYNYGNFTTEFVARSDGRLFGSNAMLSVSAPLSETQRKKHSLTNVNDSLTPTQNRSLMTPFDPTEYVLKLGGNYSVHGQAAFTLHGATSGLGDINRYWKQSLPHLLVVACSVIPDDEFKLNIVTHLPVKSYGPQTVQAVQDSLTGDYSFELNGRSRRIVVEVLRVLMEGVGALVAYGDKSADADQAVIDWGYYSLDVIRAKGMNVLTQLCKNEAYGISLVADYVNEQAAQDYRGYQFSPANLHRILLASTGIPQADGYPQYPELVNGKHQFTNQELHKWVLDGRVELMELAGPFLSGALKSHEMGGVASNLNRVLNVGGGGYHMFDPLQQLVPQVKRPEEAEIADTQGFSLVAHNMTKQILA